MAETGSRGTVHAPRHDDTDKGAIERAVFTEFVARYRSDIDITSVRSGDPLRREPDVIAKSAEGDMLLAFELVRLTEVGHTLAVDAFARKFDKARQGLYGGVHASQLELLGWSDRLHTPWDEVLQRVMDSLTPEPTGFARAWLWRRADGGSTAGVWLWEAGQGLSRFD